MTTAKVMAQNALVIVGAFFVFILLCVLGMAGWKSFERYQKRADAENQVTLNDTKIRQTEQLVRVATQDAQIEIAKAKGIHTAQEIINGTLTPLYVQHEAIQAEIALAHSSKANTVIYIPVGANGVPLVSPTGQQVLQGSSGN